MTPDFIESSRKMDNLLEQLNDEKMIAVDTEFFRETTYYPQLALVQIATDSIVACIDPLAFDAKPALKKLLLDDDITKIFHSCSQDLEVLFYYLGKIPGCIYDTQIANALLSEQHQIGYASLVENELGMQLDKSQTRTNWLQRPLTEKQIQYAGDDVFYLYQLHSLLDKKLHNTGRKTWFDEESSKLLINENNFLVATDKLWRRVKGATKLNKTKLAIVQSIAVWREHLAQQKDKTRRKILSDEIIIKLALDPPKNTSALNSYIYGNTRFNDKEIQQLFETIQTALLSPESEWPDNRFTVLDNHQKTLLKNLQLCVNSQAEKLGISSAILCSRKELEKLIVLYKQPDNQQDEAEQGKLDIMQGWRFRCLGQHLIETIKNAK
jgi:ribonuclease D